MTSIKVAGGLIMFMSITLIQQLTVKEHVSAIKPREETETIQSNSEWM